MQSIICLFFPAFVAMKVHNLFEHSKREWYGIVIQYGYYSVVINFIVCVLLYFVLGYTDSVEFSIQNSLMYTIIYLFLALIVSVIGVVFEQMLKKYISISVEVVRVEDESE